jgi:hypothetical protein
VYLPDNFEKESLGSSMNSEKKPSLAAVWNKDLEMDLTKQRYGIESSVASIGATASGIQQTHRIFGSGVSGLFIGYCEP